MASVLAGGHFLCHCMNYMKVAFISFIFTVVLVIPSYGFANEALLELPAKNQHDIILSYIGFTVSYDSEEDGWVVNGLKKGTVTITVDANGVKDSIKYYIMSKEDFDELYDEYDDEW